MSHLYLIIFISVLNKTISQKNIYDIFFNISSNNENEFLQIQNRISDNQYYIYQIIDLTSKKTWVYENVIQIIPDKLSNKKVKIKLFYPLNSEIYIKSYNEKFILGNNQNNIQNCTLTNFKFYIHEKNNKIEIPFNGIFALGNKFDDEKEDFIYQLYKQKKIKYNLFSITYYKLGKGMLFIGFYHDYLLQFHEYVSYIKIEEKDEKWRINLTHIFFGKLSQEKIPNIDFPKIQYIIRNNIIKVNLSAIISSLSKYIICPFSFLEYLNKINYFKSYCHLNNYNNEIYRFECELNNIEKIVKNIERINLVFNDVVSIFKPSQLFEIEKNKLIFIMISNYKIKNEWILGHYFMKKYMITFYKDLNIISLFSLFDKAYVIIKDNDLYYLKQIKYLLFVNCLIISFGITILLIFQNQNS